MAHQLIALDIGAGSGRAIIGRVDADTFEIREAHRFANPMTRIAGNLHWNALGLFNDIKIALAKINRELGQHVASVAIDTWGVDFGLLDRQGRLLSNPYCYRDARTNGMMEDLLTRVPREEVFMQTGGVQFLSFNTLYQLYAMAKVGDPLLNLADTMLLMPDLLTYFLTGEKVCEFSNATTTQFYNAQAREWSRGLLQQLGIPDHILPDVVMPGTLVGRLLPDVAEEVGFTDLPVYTVASHDTASAAAGVPAEGDDYAWLSSGTWSLLGGVANEPILSHEAMAFNFSSYGGAGGRILPWKNIMGLWLIQECRRIWAREGDNLSFETLTAIAAEAHPFVAVIDPDHPSFLAPENMPEAIRAFCRQTGQRAPETKGEILRVAFESLALKYRWVLEKLERITGRRTRVLHIVGGGVQNRLLCQFAADSVARPVVAGPVEATAIGSIAVQAVAVGVLPTLEDARRLILRSFETQTYQPQATEAWDAAYQRFLQVIA